MTKEQEKNIQYMATQNACKPSPNMAGATIGGLGMKHAVREGLRERLASQRYRADVQRQNADRLAELECLMDKNPDVARILELLDAVEH